MEGIAAIAVVFILLTVMVQSATAFLAHRMAQGAVAATAGRVAIAPGRESAEEVRLAEEVGSLVPGARDVVASIEVGSRVVSATVSFSFSPPGPRFTRIDMEVTADVPIVAEP